MKVCFITLILFFMVGAQASEKLAASCEAQYTKARVDHTVKVKILEIDETYEFIVSDHTSTHHSEWRVPVDNRFFFSRVEYYSYEPIRLRLMFPAIKFAKKGTLMSFAINDGEPVQLKCNINPAAQISKVTSK